ncbi:transcription factor bHLH35-like isoform X2 [Typha angustifolia]|uniref:transcription factor bHLH35-like isoform X2 n=1 Tax=Typha angustifolia TaxID=59011 RepID=UPI003C2F9912
MDEDMEQEFNCYWETQRFFESQQLDCWGWDEVSGYTAESSADGAGSSSTAAAAEAATKNIATERNRRKKLNESLYSLRSVVPNITKMDKASIIKDAIDYIQELQEQERKISAEISDFESGKEGTASSLCDLEHDDRPSYMRRKKKKRSTQRLPSAPISSTDSSSLSTNILELRVSDMGNGTLLISITCNKKRGAMIKLSKVLESLHLNITTANITSFSDSLLHTLFVETDETDSVQMKEMIKNAIAEADTSSSPISSASL